MTDDWKVYAVATDNEQDLGCFAATRLSSSHPEVIDTLDIVPGKYTGTAYVGAYHVYKNDKLYATQVIDFSLAVSPKVTCCGYIFIQPDQLVKEKVTPKCMCGAAAVYGRDTELHADNVANTCDLRRKP